MKLVLEVFRIIERRYVNNEQIENKFEWKGGRNRNIYLPNMVAISPLGILKLMTLAPMECNLSRTCIGTVGSCTKSPNISTKETGALSVSKVILAVASFVGNTTSPHKQ